MKQTEEIKAMIRGMMAQEMENFKEAVSNGEADETASPVVYTMLQVLMSKIEAMPKVWHDYKDPAPARHAQILLKDITGEVTLCHGGTYALMPGDVWAYVEDLVPNKQED